MERSRIPGRGTSNRELFSERAPGHGNPLWGQPSRRGTMGDEKTKEELIRENVSLVRRVAEMRRQGMDPSPLGGRDKSLVDLISEISDAVLAVGDLPSDEAVFRLVAEKLHSFLGAGVVAVNEWDPRTKCLVVRAYHGVGKVLKGLFKLTGGDPTGKIFEAGDEAYRALIKGTLERVPGGLYTLLFERVPEPLCRAVEKMVGVSHIYTMGLMHRGELFGNVLILTFRGESLPYPDLIETFARQFSIALQRRRAENRLRRREATYRFITENVKDVIFTLDEDLRYDYLSPSMYQVGGYRPEELLGQKVLESVGTRRQQLIQLLEELLSNPGTVEAPKEARMELRLPRRDGSEGDFEGSFCPIFDSQGRAKGILGVVRDITERRRTEQEHAKIQKLDSLGVLAGGIAHDFNNALTTIGGDLLLARKNLGAPEKLATRLAHATNACRQASKLTRQLLTFSRGGEPRHEGVPLEPLVRRALLLLMPGSNVEVELRFAEGDLTVHGDPDQLHQVFQNILANAVQAMDGKGTLTIEAKLANDDASMASQVEVKVSDTGTGISKHNLDRIFDPYFTTKPKGVGLGLSTVYSIIRRHGGRVSVSSQPGEGTCFTLLIPTLECHDSPEGLETEASARDKARDRARDRARDKERDEVRDRARGLKPTQTQPPLPAPQRSSARLSAKPSQGEAGATALAGTQGRVLVMDDDEGVREVAELFLEELGYEVALAKEGRQATALFEAALEKRQPFDAVILDLLVPGGLGGKETAAALLELSPEAKLVVASGYSDDGVLADPCRFGFKALLEKPFDLDELKSVLEDLLR